MRVTIGRSTTVFAAVTLSVALTGCGPIAGLMETFRHPAKPFDQTVTPPPPDYARPAAWAAFPGRNGLERSTPPGFTAIDEAKALPTSSSSTPPPI